jgi:mRNA interferase MazF
VKRGEIWWIAFPPPVGRRPAVLVSRNQAYRVRTAITVVPLTRTIRNIASEVPVGPSDGVPRASVANADNIVTIPKASAVEYLATLSSEKMTSLERAVKFSLDLP